MVVVMLLTCSDPGAEGWSFSLSWNETIGFSVTGFLVGSSPDTAVGNSVSTGSPNRWQVRSLAVWIQSRHSDYSSNSNIYQ